jgi:hypothetical protein
MAINSTCNMSLNKNLTSYLSRVQHPSTVVLCTGTWH